mgnify:CR=1 FL=1
MTNDVKCYKGLSVIMRLIMVLRLNKKLREEECKGKNVNLFI